MSRDEPPSSERSLEAISDEVGGLRSDLGELTEEVGNVAAALGELNETLAPALRELLSELQSLRRDIERIAGGRQ